MSALDKLDKVLQELTARGANGVPGVVLSVINKEGDTLLSKSSGYVSHLPNAEPITPSHLFRQMSTTKLFTVICTLQLLQRGLISLDDASLVDTHLPEITTQKIVRLSHDGSLSYSPRTKPMTLRHLLTHTSGVGHDFFAPALIAWRKSQGIDRNALISRFSSGKMAEGIATPLLFEPGESWMYGAGIDAAGVLIERVTGLGLEEYMRENIFEPLGLKSTSFYVQDKPQMKAKLVPVAMRKEDGSLEEIPAPNNDTPIDASGGAGLYSSPEDFLKVLQDLLQDDSKVLSKDYRDMLFSLPQFSEGSSTLNELRTQLPRIFPTMDILYKHVSINQSLAGLLWAGSEHLPRAEGVVLWFGGLGAIWFVHREKGIAGYYASQLVSPGDVKNVEIMRSFLKAALAEIPA